MNFRLGTLLYLCVLCCCLVCVPAAEADEQVPDSVDRLLRTFVEVFNAADHEAMAAFYEASATTSFNERRTEQEDRELNERLVEILGKLTVRTIEMQESGEVLMLAGRDEPGTTAELRFRLAGKPPLIDGFSVGVDPHGAAGGDHSAEAEPESAASAGDGNDRASTPLDFLTALEGVYQTQVLLQADGSILLVWVQKGPFDYDLFAARQEIGGKFSHPVRLNHAGVNRYTGDEARPSVALGSEGAVAVAWTASDNDIMLVVGSGYGRTFGPPIKLNQDEGRAYRTMPSVAFSPDGATHTVWLDPRRAPKGKEEPSDLYYARVENGIVEESNLTVRQEASVCGCCRPFIAIDDEGRFDIVFRNTTASGYRDIFRLTGEGGSFGEPQATSPPIWKLGGCPSAGPIVSAGGILWNDGSTGAWRLLWSTEPTAAPAVLVTEPKDGLQLTNSPRVVVGREEWVLVGAKPHGRVMTWNDGVWKVVKDDLPAWASSAVVRGDRLIVIGNERGRLRAEMRPL